MGKPSLKITTLVLLMSVLFVLPVHAIPTVSLNSLDSDIGVGEQFSVQVIVDGDNIGEDLLAFGFDVFTTGSVFSYDGYAIESGFDDFSSGVNNVTGDIFPGIADDDVLIATLSLTGLSAGSGSLSVKGVFDGIFHGLYYDFSGLDIAAAIDIDVSGTPVPEPATLLILGMGLIGLAGFRNKIRRF